MSAAPIAGVMHPYKELYFTDSDDTQIVDTYTHATKLGSGDCDIQGNGWSGDVGSTDCGDVFTNPSPHGSDGADVELGTLHPSEHWVSCVIKVVGVFNCGVWARASSDGAGTDGGYVALVNTTIALWDVNNGSWGWIAGDATTVNVDDDLTLKCVGTTIKVYLNTTEIISVTDATHTSGGYGLYGYDDLGAIQADTLRAGNNTQRIPPLVTYDKSGLNRRKRRDRRDRLLRKLWSS